MNLLILQYIYNLQLHASRRLENIFAFIRLEQGQPFLLFIEPINLLSGATLIKKLKRFNSLTDILEINSSAVVLFYLSELTEGDRIYVYTQSCL